MESLIADSTSNGYIFAALITGLFGLSAVLLRQRLGSVNKSVKAVHEEVRTNDGMRQGERIEHLSDDMTQVKRMMVTKADLDDHTAHDLKVSEDLRKETKEIAEELRKENALSAEAIRKEHQRSFETLNKENRDTREILLSVLRVKDE